MKIAVLANDNLWRTTGWENNNNITQLNESEFFSATGFDGYIQLDEFTQNGGCPADASAAFFVNDVIGNSMSCDGGREIYRFNGWNGFVEKEKWEISAQPSASALAILNSIGKTALVVPDIIGLVSPRVISMIINEAFYALEEKVSTRDDIDMAMKLGTNYPHGPFEWLKRIGTKHVVSLLNKLYETNPIYQPAPLLLKEPF